MMNTSSKFGAGVRQSIIAFILMIILILVASGFSDNVPSSLVGSPGEIGYVLAAHEDSTLAAIPPQAKQPDMVQQPAAIAYQSAFIPMITKADPLPPADALPTAVPEIPVEVQIITPAEEIQAPSPAIQSGAPAIQFIPLDVGSTGDEVRSWEDYPGPSVWPDMEIPTPVGILAHPEDQINILLLGSDQREGDFGFRTDTVLLMTINPGAGTVKLTSFPRDLYVYIPGYTMDRINGAFGWGGFAALADTMEYNFGVRPAYYVLINFRSFVEVIDSLGGITVAIGRDLCDHRDDFGQFCVSQGTMWMDGKTSLWYVRSRYTTSDLDRGRRQQEVLEASFNKLISLNGLTRAPELYEIYKENVTTNLTFETLARLIPVAAHLAESRDISNHSIGADQVYDWTNYSGAMVLVPIRESIIGTMRQVISEP